MHGGDGWLGYTCIEANAYFDGTLCYENLNRFSCQRRNTTNEMKSDGKKDEGVDWRRKGGGRMEIYSF